MGNLGGFVLSGGNRTEKCPACGASIDRLDIINGKYDIKEWWKFW